MAATQTDTINWLNFQVGKHLDYDHQYGQQCVDFFNFYYQFMTDGNPYSDGYAVPNAKNLWDVTNSQLTKIPDSNTLVPQPGDIAVYGAAWGRGSGHVEVVISSDNNGCTFVGENEHNDPNEGVVRVYRTWAQMRGLLGVMRFGMQPVEAAPPMYTVELITPKQVRFNKDPTNKWGLNWDFDYMATHPLAQLPVGTVMTAVALVHHKSGYKYYRMATDDPDGYNILDCDDYIPPPPPSPATITAPVTASNTEQYSLVREVPYYPSPGNAFNRTKSNGKLANGAYYVFNQQQGMYSLTKTLGQSQGTWVNPADNVIAPPKPVFVGDTTADIQKSWKWFFANHEPVEYKMLQDLVVQDIVHGGPSIQVHKGRTIDIYGSFEKDGKIYLRPFTASDLENRYHFYGIPTTDIYSGAPYADNEFNVVDNISARWESFYDKAIKTIEGIFRPLKRKK